MDWLITATGVGCDGTVVGTLGRLGAGILGAAAFLMGGMAAGASWAADRNVSIGGCGYDGTCTEDGLIETLGVTYLLLFLAAAAVVLGVSWIRYRTGSPSVTGGGVHRR